MHDHLEPRTAAKTAKDLATNPFAMREWVSDYKLFCACHCQCFDNVEQYKEQVEQELERLRK